MAMDDEAARTQQIEEALKHALARQQVEKVAELDLTMLAVDVEALIGMVPPPNPLDPEGEAIYRAEFAKISAVRPEEAETGAALNARVFANLAKRQGISPLALYRQYNVGIEMGGPATTGALRQVGQETPEFRAWFGDSKVVDEAGQLIGIASIDDLLEVLAEEMSELAKIVAREQAHEVQARK